MFFFQGSPQLMSCIILNPRKQAYALSPTGLGVVPC